MSIPIIVASLTLVHLRDEIIGLKKELSRIEIKIDELENSENDEKWKETYSMCEDPDVYYDSSISERYYKSIIARYILEHKNTHMAIKIILDQSIEAYNNILIILKEDSGEDMSEYKYFPEDHVCPVDMSIRGDLNYEDNDYLI